MTNTTHHL